jgi:hypothetical protein
MHPADHWLNTLISLNKLPYWLQFKKKPYLPAAIQQTQENILTFFPDILLQLSYM